MTFEITQGTIIGAGIVLAIIALYIFGFIISCWYDRKRERQIVDQLVKNHLYRLEQEVRDEIEKRTKTKP